MASSMVEVIGGTREHQSRRYWEGGAPSKGGLEILTRRNEELEKELKERLEREERAREDMERLKERLRTAEEAEERLCFQLGELEAESVEMAREHHLEMRSLKEQLSHAHHLLQSLDYHL